MPKQLITEQVVNQARAEGATELQVEPGAIITALAADVAQSQGLSLIRTSEAIASGPQPSPALKHDAVASSETDRDLIRKAVIAHFGVEPDSLETILNRVLGN